MTFSTISRKSLQTFVAGTWSTQFSTLNSSFLPLDYTVGTKVGFFLKFKFPLRNLSRFFMKLRFHSLFTPLDLRDIRLRFSLIPRFIYASPVNTKSTLLWPFVTGSASPMRSSDILNKCCNMRSAYLDGEWDPDFFTQLTDMTQLWGLWTSGISAVSNEEFIDANIYSCYTRYQLFLLTKIVGG